MPSKVLIGSQTTGAVALGQIEAPGRVRVGERFVMYKGYDPIEAVVIEDRGNLGVGGRQLVRIRELPTGPYDEQREYEVPAENIPAYGVPPAAPSKPAKQRGAKRAVPTVRSDRYGRASASDPR